jgi:prefoldin subunit 5
MDYKRIHESIMKSDPRIRLVTICDLNGKIMHSEHREGVKNLLTPEESKRSLELAVNAWKTRSELTPKIGKGKYVLAEYEKIKRITMPLGENHLLYVTTEIDADHSVITRSIAKLDLR